MSLTAWSVVFFIAQALFYVSIYAAMFTKVSAPKFILAVFMWFVQLFVTLIYGMSTGQIGFVMIFFLEIMMIMMVYGITRKIDLYEDIRVK